ncbi:MAG TPA: LuxR C-terminal-related transcriptional regulator, partial [Dehalococcoidia bacterium]|nr:LuxR C-terminal-related transcriptional regulator [Dehalococcoidia bacterium]
DAVEAIGEAARTLPRPPQVVICDLNLRLPGRTPGRSGAEAIRYLVDLGCAVLATSGVATPDEVLDAVVAGAHGYLEKTASSQAFVRAVSALAAGSYYVTPALAESLLKDAELRPLQQDELTTQARTALRYFARGNTADEVAAKLGLVPGRLTALLDRVWDAARRRRRRYALAPREREVVALVAQGRSHQEIAAQLGISQPWVADLLAHIRDKYLATHPDASPTLSPLAAAHLSAADLGIGVRHAT